jgi:hypothetical protein
MNISRAPSAAPSAMIPMRPWSLPVAQSIRICGFLSLAVLGCVSFRGGAVPERFSPPTHDAGSPAIHTRFDEPRQLPRTWPEPAQLVLFGVGLNCIGAGLGRRKS